LHKVIVFERLHGPCGSIYTCEIVRNERAK
jgi:hypothetical protein